MPQRTNSHRVLLVTPMFGDTSCRHENIGMYRVSIKSFPDYKHLLQENYVEYKQIFLLLLKLVSKNFLN